jgi:two-component system OmpR family response regulator
VRLLLVEDERRLGAHIAKGLREEGFAVDHLETVTTARDAAIATEYDLAIIDLQLPDGFGLDLLREWRDEGRVFPVLVLTSRDRLEDKIEGLDAGADDYVTKPFDFEELLARLRALLRRRAIPLKPVLVSGRIRVDRAARSATIGELPLVLTSKEFALLEQFLLHEGMAVSRESLAEHVWDDRFEARSNVIDVLVSRLRRKLEAAGESGRLHAVVGVGWAFRDAGSGE